MAGDTLGAILCWILFLSLILWCIVVAQAQPEEEPVFSTYDDCPSGCVFCINATYGDADNTTVDYTLIGGMER